MLIGEGSLPTVGDTTSCRGHPGLCKNGESEWASVCLHQFTALCFFTADEVGGLLQVPTSVDVPR